MAGLSDGGANPNVAWAAGGLVFDARDIGTFFGAPLSGRVPSPSWLRELQRVVAVPGDPDYALGIAPARLSCGTAWGNDGVILDYGAGVEAADHGSRVAVVSLRGAVSPAPDETATLLLCPRRVRG